MFYTRRQQQMGMVFDRYVKKEEEVFDKQELLDKNRQ
jgi:hypothetical protein